LTPAISEHFEQSGDLGAGGQGGDHRANRRGALGQARFDSLQQSADETARATHGEISGGASAS